MIYLGRGYFMFVEVKGFNEECGIFGIWDYFNVVEIIYYGLYSL